MQTYKTIPAGLTHTTILPDMDFETYSESGYYWDAQLNKWRAPDGFPKGKPGLQSIGAARYAEHPSTELLCLDYNLKDGRGPRSWIAGMPPPKPLCDHIAAGGLIEAWYIGFEYFIWHYIAHLRMGWPVLSLNQIRCAMAKGAAYGIPGALDKAAAIVCPGTPKNPIGKKLIHLLCCPHTPTKKNPLKRLTPESDPTLFLQLYHYCGGDIKAESGVSKKVPDLPPDELELWQLDQTINTRGVQIDIKGLNNCIEICKQATEKYTKELRSITGLSNLTINQLDKIKRWMAVQGFVVNSLAEENVNNYLLLKNNPPPNNCRRVLEIRQLLGSAGIKKLYAIDRWVNTDGRVRGLYQYYGARQTGRFSGRGPQPQNIVSGGPAVVECSLCYRPYYKGLNECQYCLHTHCRDINKPTESRDIDWSIEAAELALEAIESKQLPEVERLWGGAIKAVSGCLRALFVARPGYDLICSDFAAIEAVCLAAEAGEEWRLEVFRTHGKIYEMSASRVTGISFQEFLDYKERTGRHHIMRKKIGKPYELGCGYQGWINACKKFGADKFQTDEEIKQGILKWRAASPMIVEYWGGQWRKDPDFWEFTSELYGIEGTAVTAILNPGEAFTYRGITYGVHNDILYCRLLSGRHLTYHQPRLYNDFNPLGQEILKITYMGWNSDSTKGPVGWMRRSTYGGSLVENITQGLARCRFTYSLVKLEKSGYPIVLHSHDEPVAEVLKGYGSIAEVENIMMENPEWCIDWPIKATGGWRGFRYRKG